MLQEALVLGQRRKLDRLPAAHVKGPGLPESRLEGHESAGVLLLTHKVLPHLLSHQGLIHHLRGALVEGGDLS